MARAIGDIMPGIILRARRIALVAELVKTYGDPTDRKDMIMALYQGGALTAETAELLIENFGLEAA